METVCDTCIICPLKPKNFIWFCLVGVLHILFVKETLNDMYIICQESYFVSELDHPHENSRFIRIQLLCCYLNLQLFNQ